MNAAFAFSACSTEAQQDLEKAIFAVVQTGVTDCQNPDDKWDPCCNIALVVYFSVNTNTHFIISIE